MHAIADCSRAWRAPTQDQISVMIPHVHTLGLVDYQSTWDAMKQFTIERTAETRDEIWLLQHPPTYTQGLAGLPEHLLNPTNIPVVKIDRGGQITYHGPGQVVAYLLLDMRRWKIGVRELVTVMENSVIDLLAEYGVHAANRLDAPGVYVNNAKIAALGLKIKHGCCYHGLSFNVDMDLTPFNNINPCGYQGLKVTQACQLGISANINELQAQLAQNLVHGLQRHVGAGHARDTEQLVFVGASPARESVSRAGLAPTESPSPDVCDSREQPPKDAPCH